MNFHVFEVIWNFCLKSFLAKNPFCVFEKFHWKICSKNSIEIFILSRELCRCYLSLKPTILLEIIWIFRKNKFSKQSIRNNQSTLHFLCHLLHCFIIQNYRDFFKRLSIITWISISKKCHKQEKFQWNPSFI